MAACLGGSALLSLHGGNLPCQACAGAHVDEVAGILLDLHFAQVQVDHLCPQPSIIKHMLLPDDAPGA